jgi:hypothetical protein
LVYSANGIVIVSDRSEAQGVESICGCSSFSNFQSPCHRERRERSPGSRIDLRLLDAQG